MQLKSQAAAKIWYGKCNDCVFVGIYMDNTPTQNHYIGFWCATKVSSPMRRVGKPQSALTGSMR